MGYPDPANFEYSVKAISTRRNFRFISLRQVAPLTLVLATVTIMGYSLIQGTFAVFMAYLIFLIVGLLIVWKGGSTSVRLYFLVYGLATIAAVILAFVFFSNFGVPYWGGGSDELHFEEKGLEFAQNYGLFEYDAIRAEIVNSWHNSVGYIYLIGLLAKFGEFFGGFHTMIPRLFNAACLALISVLIYSISLRLGLKRRTALAAALFAGCLPLMIWVSVQTLRDIIQTLLLVTLVFLWLPDKNSRFRYSIPVLLFLSVLLLVPQLEMRIAQAFVGFLLVIAAILLNRNSFRPVHLVLFTLPFVLAIIYLSSIFNLLLSNNIIHLIEQIEKYAMLRGGEGSGGGLSLVVFETPLFPIGWIFRVAYALVSPIPVNFKSLDNIWLSIGTMVQILFLPYLWMGLRRAVKYTNWRYIGIAFILLFIGMAMFTFTIRHITQFMPFAILLAAYGYENYSGNKFRLLLTIVWFSTALGVLYLFLKLF